MIIPVHRSALKFANHFVHKKLFHASRLPIILGIETSCDDTGCAIVDGDGNILGESLRSQHLVHLKCV